MRDEEFDAMMDRLGPAVQRKVLNALDVEVEVHVQPVKHKNTTVTTIVLTLAALPLMFVMFWATVLAFFPLAIPVTFLTYCTCGWLYARLIQWRMK